MICKFLGMCALASSLTGVPIVTDGDTLRLNGQTIRLQGIDAPELHEPGGVEAKDALVVFAGKHLTCTDTGQRTHRRIVATCQTADGRDLGQLMVRWGVALDCARFSKGRYRHLEPAGARDRIQQKGYC